MNSDETYEGLVSTMAARIKELRISAGYSGYENFAFDHDLDRKQYWRLENGQNMSLKSLARILDLHQIGIKWFINDPTSGVDFG